MGNIKALKLSVGHFFAFVSAGPKPITTWQITGLSGGYFTIQRWVDGSALYSPFQAHALTLQRRYERGEFSIVSSPTTFAIGI
jgi:hypothetical protein